MSEILRANSEGTQDAVRPTRRRKTRESEQTREGENKLKLERKLKLRDKRDETVVRTCPTLRMTMMRKMITNEEETRSQAETVLEEAIHSPRDTADDRARDHVDDTFDELGESIDRLTLSVKELRQQTRQHLEEAQRDAAEWRKKNRDSKSAASSSQRAGVETQVASEYLVRDKRHEVQALREQIIQYIEQCQNPYRYEIDPTEKDHDDVLLICEF